MVTLFEDGITKCKYSTKQSQDYKNVASDVSKLALRNKVILKNI